MGLHMVAQFHSFTSHPKDFTLVFDHSIRVVSPLQPFNIYLPKKDIEHRASATRLKSSDASLSWHGSARRSHWQSLFNPYERRQKASCQSLLCYPTYLPLAKREKAMTWTLKLSTQVKPKCVPCSCQDGLSTPMLWTWHVKKRILTRTQTHIRKHTHTEIHTLHRYLILHTIHGIPLQYDTRQYSTWHCITFYTLHYITVHYITFHYSTLHYIRIQQVVHRTTLHTLHKVSLHDIELHYITLPHSMLGVYRTPLCVQLKWPSLSKFSGIWNISSDISAPRVPARPCSCGMLYIYT